MNFDFKLIIPILYRDPAEKKIIIHFFNTDLDPCACGA